ncbi:hypothetical protein OF83DRAFT_1193499 [Amylostereum chailletii]|nr:hypothetical protein OF83DRAFT_1193499 [Amylostereum chailletii]
MGDSQVMELAQKIIDISNSQLTPPSDENANWKVLETSAQALADLLRVKSPEFDNQAALGETTLPAALTSVIKSAIGGSRTPHPTCLSSVYEVLRVAANLCMDNDPNRGQLLDAEFPQSIVHMLEGYLESIPHEYSGKPLPLSIPDLKVVKTSIGVLLNASIGYDAVKSRLTSLETAMTILRLSFAIYPPGAWMTETPESIFPQTVPHSDQDAQESWTLRSVLSSWAWRTLDELKDESRNLFGPESLPLFTQSLILYMPPVSSQVSSGLPPSLTKSLVSSDFDVFEGSCSSIESLVMDVEDVRLSLARGMTFPDEHQGVHCLADILRFIDLGTYHPLWSTDATAERSRKEKAFDLCKAALIKSVVEIAGEEKSIDILWDESDSSRPGGAFVTQMVDWIKAHRNLNESTREDLIICATLSLGNLVRYEAHSVAIIEPPIALGPYLASILEPEADMKVKHGVTGLLRHLAYAAPARTPLGEAGIVERLVSSNVFKDTSDIAEIVQLSAIGILKNLCNGNAKNCFSFILNAEGSDAEGSGLRQILSLASRSDTVAIKSESTRVLVNAIRTLWSQATPDSEQRTKAMTAVTSPVSALALAQLIGRSKRYPTLINEGMVALTLLSLSAPGANLVFDAITAPLPTEAQQHAGPLGDSSDVTSPVSAPGRALDMLQYVLKRARFQEEVRVNVCVLLGSVGRSGAVTGDRETEVTRFKSEVTPLLEAEAAVEAESRLKVAAKRAMVMLA